MSYFPPQRSNSRFTLHPPVAAPPRPAQPSFRPPARFQSPSVEDTASVCSEQTHLIGSESQADLVSSIKVEVEEAVKAFSQVTLQQSTALLQSVTALREDTVAAWRQDLDTSLQREAAAAVAFLERMRKNEEELKAQYEAARESVAKELSVLQEQLHSVRSFALTQADQMDVSLRNIEKRLKRRPRKYGKRVAYYLPGELGPIRKPAEKWCDCLLKSGKRLTRSERAKRVADGTLVCTCKA